MSKKKKRKQVKGKPGGISQALRPKQNEEMPAKEAPKKGIKRIVFLIPLIRHPRRWFCFFWP